MSKTIEPNTVYMEIGPEKALNWLENANTNNRKVMDKHVRKLARDMKNGKWQFNHQGIAFSSEGVLLDGQHRLWAIVESGMTIKMAVTFNMPPQSKMTIDVIQSRSMADVLRLSGNNGNISRNHISTLRSLLGGYHAYPVLTTQEASQYMDIYGAAIDFALKHLPCNSPSGISNGTTRAVIARAWYSVDHDKLAKFCRILTSGIIPPSPYAYALVRLREYLQNETRHNLPTRRVRYGKMQRALTAFLKNESLKNLLAAAEENFPIPGSERIKETA